MIGPAGIQDTRLRFTLPWDDVEGLELWEQYIPRGPARRYLGIRTKIDPMAGHPRVRATLQVAMRFAASSATTPEPPELSIPLTGLELDSGEIVDA